METLTPKTLNQIRPKKYLGQHFLISEKILRDIVQTIDPQPNDIIIEVGAGTGVLTFALAPKIKHIIAVEKDAELAELLKKEAKEKKFSNISVAQKDILKFPHPWWPKRQKNFKLVGNIPYYLTGRLLRKIFEERILPERIVLLVQEEVAQRLLASPPQSNLLGLSVQAYGRVKLLTKVPASAFHPVPHVDSRTVIIQEISRKLFEKAEIKPEIAENLFFRVIRAAFSQKRKLLVNSLADGLKVRKGDITVLIAKAKIKSSARAQELGVKDFTTLTKVLGPLIS